MRFTSSSWGKVQMPLSSITFVGVGALYSSCLCSFVGNKEDMHCNVYSSEYICNKADKEVWAWSTKNQMTQRRQLSRGSRGSIACYVHDPLLCGFLMAYTFFLLSFLSFFLYFLRGVQKGGLGGFGGFQVRC